MWISQFKSLERNERRVSVLVNVRGRDTASFVADASKALHEKVVFPDGYYFEFGGQFQNLVEAKQRLTIVVPLALALIFVLIFLSFRSLSQAALIFTCVPLAVTGEFLPSIFAECHSRFRPQSALLL